MSSPPPQEPSANPAIKTESTIETIGVVTPNLAIASRSHMVSYTRLQKPDTRKNTKYHALFIGALLRIVPEKVLRFMDRVTVEQTAALSNRTPRGSKVREK